MEVLSLHSTEYQVGTVVLNMVVQATVPGLVTDYPRTNTLLSKSDTPPFSS